ncbi:LysR family transcriptional regulator [Propionivibrio limicola]|uniref:LysR family transcriptional regulator n=1 Tax=Propionivibrio limicola TaxID=167645 RepID=UPI00129218CD|nr:LysR family transcriptional regulator [Propionivibrio limicola]
MHESEHGENILDVKDLRLLETLYSTQSVTKAAEILGLSQPNVSTWLRRLRLQVKDPLFVRTSDGMAPTPRADKLLAKIQFILRDIRQLTEDEGSFDPGSSRRVFRMCIPDSAQITLFPKMLRHFRKCAPDVRLEALPVNANTARLLETGEADLAFGSFVPGMVAGYYQQALFELDFVCLVSADHPRINQRLTLENYLGEAHVALSYGSANAFIEAEMRRQRIERRVLVTLQGFLGVAKIIETTDMIATLPREIGATLAAGASIHLFPCPVPVPSYMVSQYWHARFHHDPGNRWLRSICAEQARTDLFQASFSIKDAPESLLE